MKIYKATDSEGQSKYFANVVSARMWGGRTALVEEFEVSASAKVFAQALNTASGSGTSGWWKSRQEVKAETDENQPA